LIGENAMSDVKLRTARDYGAIDPAADDPSQLQRRPATSAGLPIGLAAPRRRLPWRLVTFFLAVIAPTALAAGYLYGVSRDQYVSEFRFRLRHAQPSKLENASALAGLEGAGAALETMTDSEIVVQYLQSRQVLDDLRPSVDLDAVYGRPDADWWNRLPPGEPIEDKLRYWRRVIDPFFDVSTGVVSVKVRAFEPADAQTVSAAMLRSAERLVNRLSERAQADKLAYAHQSVVDELAAWKSAEKSLRDFRNQNEVVLPSIQATESTRLDGALRTSESWVRAALDAMRARGISTSSPQAAALQAQLASIETELRRTQTEQTRADPPASLEAARPAESFASVLTAYEGLDVDAKIAAKSYEMAVMAEQRAHDEASQQQIYLDTFVSPAMPERSLYPVRWRMVLQIGFTSVGAWLLGTLLWRGVMDHIE
jgi:capsular polysaccharide transport system permease protein